MEFKRLITLLSLLLSGFSWSQAGFYHIYTGNGYDRGEGAVQLADSGYLVTGTTSSLEDAPSQVLLMRTDKKGLIQWSKSFGGPESEEGKRVFNFPGYGYLVAGTSSSGPSRNFDAYVFATDFNGNLKWDTIIDNGAWERIHDARLLPDSTLLMVGETDATANGNKDAWLLAVDYTGKFLWKQQIGSSKGEDAFYAIDLASDTSVFIGGTVYDETAKSNMASIRCMSNKGVFYWERLYGTDGFNQFNDLIRDGDRVKAVGQSKRAGKADNDVFAVSAKMNGDEVRREEWYNPSDNSRYANVIKCKASPEGNLFLSVQLIDQTSYEGGEDVLIFRGNHEFYFYNTAGNYSGLGQDQLNELVPTLDGYALGVGYHTQYGTGGSSLFLVKISSETSFPANNSSTTYNIASLEDLKENDWIVYPNPANETLHIRSKQEKMEVEIRNLLGEVIVKEMFNGTADLNLNDFSNGTYLLTCKSDNGSVLTKRIVVVH